MSIEYSPFKVAVIEKVLENENNSTRFELFANAVVSAIEGGAKVLSTSASWDNNRDGVGYGSAAGLYVCTSLRDDIDSKATDDLEGLTQKTQGIKRVYVCLSHPLSEHRRSKLEGQLSALIDSKFPITCLGGNQIAEIAAKSGELPELYYGSEIADIVRVLTAQPSDGAQLRGLRLALIASSADDSDSIRKATYAAGLLDVLSEHKSLTAASCAKAFSESLRLHRSIAAETCRLHLNVLVASGLVGSDGTSYWITESGKSDATSRKSAAAGRLLQLKASIKGEIEESLRTPIVDDEFHRVWLILEDKLTQYFLTRGEEIVSEIASLMSNDGGTAEVDTGKSSSLTFLDDLAEAVAAAVTTAERKSEFNTAIRDIFSDRLGPAAEWLIRVAASFVSAAAMGLEHQSAEAVASLLKKTSIVLDTDVLLSLVGIDEPEHQGVKSLVTRWKELTGKVFVAEPVLEEFARHAHIAEVEFDHVQHLLPGTPEDRLILFKNVFVRAFGNLVAQGSARRNQWKTYIGQFRGAHVYDWSAALTTLVYDHGLEKLAPRSLKEAALEDQVRKYLVSLADESRSQTPYAQDKARRDAQLYAAIAHHLKSIRALDPAANCVLVSSARRLSIAEERFKIAADYQIVSTISSMLYLISLMPGVSLGLSAMKSFLFEGYRPGLSSELERTLLRMVRASKERELAFAQRGVLMKTVRDRFVRDAHEKGLRAPVERLIANAETEALAPENQQRTLAILAEALDKVGASNRVERENAELRRKNAELERELARRTRKGKA
jgi:hypothetical protein